MKKVWIRLGGFISADEDTIKKIMSGDEEALVKAIKDNGFELNGETYIPADENDDESEDVDFDLNPIVLTFFRDAKK